MRPVNGPVTKRKVNDPRTSAERQIVEVNANFIKNDEARARLKGP